MAELDKTYKVLVVDDVINNFTYLMNVLRRLNCNVIYAGDGRQAIDKVNEIDDLDLIFMDLNLPVISGFEATKIIKKQKKHIPVIAVTAYSSGENRKRAKIAGCDDYLVKPVFKIQIENIINKYKNTFINKTIDKKSFTASKYL